MENIKPYTKYKSSGISWLGDVPEHWSIKRIKYVFKEQDKRSEIGLEDLLSVSHYTGVTRKSDKVMNGDFMTNAKTLVGYKIVEKGDLVINIMLAWNGSLGISKFDGITSPAYCVYKSLIGGEKYFGYLFRTKNAQQEFKKQSTGIIDSRLRLYTDKFFNIKTVIPSLEEQTAIANFLDYKTAKIDRFIRKKKQLIKLLNEQKAGIINHAVTKGLDPNATMKDSGIEWLGDIPEHWEVRKMKGVLAKEKGALKPGPFGSDLKNSDVFSTGIKVYNQRAVLDNNFDITEECITNEKFENLKVFEVLAGDILLTTRGTIGRCCIVPEKFEKGIIHPCIIRLRIDTNMVIHQFVKLFIEQANAFQIALKLNSNATTIDVIYGNTLKDVFFIVPSIKEQQKIIDYIEQETSKLNQLIQTIEKEIVLTQEYRTALILEAVTGKIDVRAFVIPTVSPQEELYEEIEEELDMVAEDGESYENE